MLGAVGANGTVLRWIVITLASAGALLVFTPGAFAAKVMTWNVLSPASPKEIGAVARKIARRRPGVVGLQEVCNQQMDAIVRRLRRSGLRYHARPGTVSDQDERCGAYGSAFGQAILSRRRIRASRNFTWRILGDETIDGDEKRGYMWVDTRIAGRRVRVYNTHIGLWSRCSQRVIVRRLARRAARQRRAIVLGDFNATPTRRVEGGCLGPTRPRRRVMRSLYRRFQEVDRRRRPTSDSGGKIDYVFLHRLRRAGARILGEGPSDHHPLMGRVR